jgi:hypothetical protein
MHDINPTIMSGLPRRPCYSENREQEKRPAIAPGFRFSISRLQLNPCAPVFNSKIQNSKLSVFLIMRVAPRNPCWFFARDHAQTRMNRDRDLQLTSNEDFADRHFCNLLAAMYLADSQKQNRSYFPNTISPPTLPW